MIAFYITDSDTGDTHIIQIPGKNGERGPGPAPFKALCGVEVGHTGYASQPVEGGKSRRTCKECKARLA